MRAREIIDFMDGWAPKDLAEDWDNVGFQIGDDGQEVARILLALDLDSQAFHQARENSCQMIISHHPFIFQGLKSITNRDYDGSLVMELIKSNMVFYASHTNLDQVADGVNQELALAIGLKDLEVLDPVAGEKSLGYGRLGSFGARPGQELIEKIKLGLGLDQLRVYGDLEDLVVEKVGVMGGSGASYIEMAARAGAQVLVTGDVKYHDGQLANKLGLVLVDAGHFHTEYPILAKIKSRLEDWKPELEIFIYDQASPSCKIY